MTHTRNNKERVLCLLLKGLDPACASSCCGSASVAGISAVVRRSPYRDSEKEASAIKFEQKI
jgi:hypothetical protein